MKNFYSISDQKYSIFAKLSRLDPGIRYSSFISTGSSLVPRAVRPIRVTRGGLEPTVTSHPESPRTTGNEAEPAVQQVACVAGATREGGGEGRGGEKGKREGSSRSLL